MARFIEGQRVRYMGDGRGREAGLEMGVWGTVVARSVNAAHVLWDAYSGGGERQPSMVLVADSDLVPGLTDADHFDETVDAFDNAFESVAINRRDGQGWGRPVPARFAVRDIYDRGGDKALIRAMGETGQLVAFPSIAQEALGVVCARLREDPSFRQALALLSPTEAEDFLHVASVTLLRDSFAS